MIPSSHPFESLALAASVVMPLWNFPLIARVVKRRSSADMSLGWLWGVWVCMLLMLPWGFITRDKVMSVFSIINFSCFSGVVAVVMRFRPRDAGKGV